MYECIAKHIRIDLSNFDELENARVSDLTSTITDYFKALDIVSVVEIGKILLG